MSKFWLKQTKLISAIADVLLLEGVAQIPLRDLAAKLGTSDRMLLYYFETKEELVQRSLDEISVRLSAILAKAISNRRASPKTLLRKIIPLCLSAEISPYMTVWSDISARGSRGEEPFRNIARASVQRWLHWLEDRLLTGQDISRRDTAVALLTIIEGARLLESSEPGSTNRAVAILSRSLDRRGR